jgi:hypothetical protein
MRFAPIAIAVLVGTLAAACTVHETRTVAVPADDSCSAYGYAPGTEAHRICAEREAAARRRGRMQAGYAQAMIAADAQEACLSYGLAQGTDRYDRCIRREVNYRRPG